MASYQAAVKYGLRLHQDTGKRVRIYGVRTTTCCCASAIPHDFQGTEWYARTLPSLPLKMPDLSVKF